MADAKKVKPTLKDVAQEAGVSYTTASLVLSGKGKISEKVRKRVLHVATELGYWKKSRMSSDTKKKTKYIAILHYVSWEYLWHFLKPLINQLEEVLLDVEYFPLIMNMNQSLPTEDIFNKIIASGAHGVCSIHYSNETLFVRLEELGIPVVITNNSDIQNKFDSVCVDDFQGSYEGTSRLIELGHRTIAYLEYHRPDLSAVVADRFIGFKKAIDEYNLPFTKDQRITTDLFDTEELEKRLRVLFSKKQKPTAIFAHDDYFAARVIAALHTLNLNIPDDVSIIAHGDTLPYGELFTPQISTMSINTMLIGKLAGDLIINRLKMKTQPKEIHVLKVKQQLIERESCRKIAL